MSDHGTERGQYVYVVKEGATADDPCWIYAEPSSSELDVLSDGFLFLKLRPDAASYRDALELAQMLNARVESLSYTRLPSDDETS